eukprot:RCo033821
MAAFRLSPRSSSSPGGLRCLFPPSLPRPPNGTHHSPPSRTTRTTRRRISAESFADPTEEEGPPDAGNELLFHAAVAAPPQLLPGDGVLGLPSSSSGSLSLGHSASTGSIAVGSLSSGRGVGSVPRAGQSSGSLPGRLVEPVYVVSEDEEAAAVGLPSLKFCAPLIPTAPRPPRSGKPSLPSAVEPLPALIPSSRGCAPTWGPG